MKNFASSFAALRQYPRIEQWIVSLHHMGQYGAVRGTDLMALIPNGKFYSDSPAVADQILSAMELEKVLNRGNLDLTGGAIAYSSASAVASFEGKEAIYSYPRHFAWMPGEKFAEFVEILKAQDRP